MNGIEDIFQKLEFRKYVYKILLEGNENGLSNSDLAKKTSKELLGRQFLSYLRAINQMSFWTLKQKIILKLFSNG